MREVSLPNSLVVVQASYRTVMSLEGLVNAGLVAVSGRGVEGSFFTSYQEAVYLLGEWVNVALIK